MLFISQSFFCCLRQDRAYIPLYPVNRTHTPPLFLPWPHSASSWLCYYSVLTPIPSPHHSLGGHVAMVTVSLWPCHPVLCEYCINTSHLLPPLSPSMASPKPYPGCSLSLPSHQARTVVCVACVTGRVWFLSLTQILPNHPCRNLPPLPPA